LLGLGGLRSACFSAQSGSLAFALRRDKFFTSSIKLLFELVTGFCTVGDFPISDFNTSTGEVAAAAADEATRFAVDLRAGALRVAAFLAVLVLRVAFFLAAAMSLSPQLFCVFPISGRSDTGFKVQWRHPTKLCVDN
jgi:hypothetical protein